MMFILEPIETAQAAIGKRVTVYGPSSLRDIGCAQPEAISVKGNGTLNGKLGHAA